MSPIKEKLISIMQKTAVIFFACLMLITMFPPGLFTPDKPSADGELVRLGTSGEVFSATNANGGAKIGGGNCAYLKFGLEAFDDVPVDEIKYAGLRLVFLKGTGSRKNKVLLHEYVGHGLPNEASAFSISFDKPLAAFYPEITGDENSLSEIDLTEFVKKQIKNNKREVVFSISGDMPISAALASSSHADAAYRPTLKILTGIAEDDDPKTINKAELKETATVSERLHAVSGRALSTDSNVLVAGGKNEIYLKFDLVEGAVLGEVSRAVLSLNKIDDTKSGAVKVYCINNNEWTADTISYEQRPRGEETSVPSVAVNGSGRINLDITQAICEARSNGISTLTVRITGSDSTPIRFSGYGDIKTQPRMYIDATDNADVVCAAKGALYALGKNKAGFVTMNLQEAYQAENGKIAKIRWTEYNMNGFEQTGSHITESGQLTRPKWFEGSVKIIAKADISCGAYATMREFILNIPAESAPNYTGRGFDNYIDIGNRASEEDQAFEFARVSGIKRRWVSGKLFNCRTIYESGAMALNFSCLPDCVNYLTLKFRADDEVGVSSFMLSAYPQNNPEVPLSEPLEIKSEEPGFIYATYAIPRSFTDGKKYVSLCLSNTADSFTAEESRGIYAAYLTQSPFFDPVQFASSGEEFIKTPIFGKETINEFIKNLKVISQNIGFIEMPREEEKAPAESVAIDASTGVVAFAGDEANIVFSVGESLAKVYERLDYYDKASEACPVINDGEVAVVDYGKYKLLWNKSAEQRALPEDMPEMSGVYKSVGEDKYYIFSEERQMTDDSVIPENAESLVGEDIVIPPSSALLLTHMADPLKASDWRVNKINDKTVSSLMLAPDEKIGVITVKAIGGVSSNAERVNVIFAVYEDGRPISISQKNASTSLSRDIYSVDFSDCDICVKKGTIIKIFVNDDADDLTRLSPKLEMTT